MSLLDSVYNLTFVALDFLIDDSLDYLGGRFKTRFPFLAVYFGICFALLYLDIRIASRNPSTEPELREIELQQNMRLA